MHRFLVCILLLAAMAPAALAAPGADIAISMSDLDTARSVAIASDLMDRRSRPAIASRCSAPTTGSPGRFPTSIG